MPIGTPTPASQPLTETDWSMTADTGESSKRGVGLIIGVVLGVIVLLGGGVTAAIVVPGLLKGGKDPGADVEKVEEGKTAAKKPGKDDGKKAAAEQVTLDLEGLPGDARVTLDGKELAYLPARLPRSTDEQKLRVIAEGYALWETTVVLDGPKSLKVDLQPEDTEEEPAGKKKGGKKKDGAKEPVVVKIPGKGTTSGDLKEPDLPSKVTVTKKKGTKSTKGIYSGKKKNIELEYPE